jgi:hypothetical protein
MDAEPIDDALLAVQKGQRRIDVSGGQRGASR